ncbi:ABC transporter ATP-binding protein [Desulfovibrio subterraneus]|jgi:putative ABC transport system ATP-binding protein|uniref:Macrolide export ATP-binding/permease protein MacB n=1 Tax=Desulfovibrio subterraneus TaxID=2718620 RepID=A0A7J0BIH7_9BACT|nr:ABC transporter ATP-binding protein [Desulfovibrio subterraneus]WBF67210.1 ABC transporter ATP-binding protein [Desulfovibrio subterraneus]GFM32955.1 macrolide export ATP-binding/permease protein MacB [Desulfovibrio subterraneus]
MGTESPYVVRTEALTRTFRQGDLIVEAVKPLDMRIGHGEMVAIQGASGSGKSTLLHLLALLDSPSAGHYYLDGTDTAGMDDDTRSAARNTLVGMVFQSFYLIPYATALDNVMLPGLYGDTGSKALRERAESLLERVGLSDRMHFKPSSLSGGQQQRVALARALLNDPPLLLADEPTGQLDTTTGKDILDLFASINAAGKTVVIVTHDPQTAARAARRIEFADGHVVDDTAL